MDSQKRRLSTLFLALGAALGTFACTSGGGGGAGSSAGGLTILSCSLGCSVSSGAGGQLSCGVTDVYLNQEIRITFSAPINLSSVTNNSFRMVELKSGKTPPGAFERDAVDPRVLIYRPLLTFDSTGNPIFGLTQGESYRLLIPGTALDTLGPFIQSVAGVPNASRLSCTLLASRGIFDATPGPPRHEMTVTTIDPASYNANGFPTVFMEENARGARNVFRNSNVRIVFDDVMNPATLANPVTGVSNTVSVRVDPDGNTADPSDQIPVSGVFSITPDQTSLTTTVLFRPSSGFPSSGKDLLNPRRIVVNLSPTIVDLGGNPLVQPGNTVFVVESIPFPTVEVSEGFDTATFEDSEHSGGAWGGGMLGPGPGGGSGRLGELFIPAGETASLDTDSEDFSGPEYQDARVFNIVNVVDIDDPATFSVDGGVFEFNRFVVEAGATLFLTGSNPARFLVRGECLIQGEIEARGGDGPIQAPRTFEGGVAGPPGPGGGLGGSGGARPDGELFASSLDPFGMLQLDNPNDPGPVGIAEVLDPAAYALVNGQDGVGIGFPDPLLPRAGAGLGGLAWPQPGVLPPPFDMIHFPADPLDAINSFPFEPFAFCQINAPGAVGAGAAYALSGTSGNTAFIPAFKVPPIAPEALGGDSLDLALDPVARSLAPELGFLRGGAGGGGGGGHLETTQVNGTLLTDCTIGSPLGSALRITNYANVGGAAGGSGGGAVQVQTGRRFILNGKILAPGGNGGSASGTNLCQPGGGGSGGAILLQGPLVTVQSIPARLDVAGGIGGQAFPSSVGGRGGPGLVRIESFAPAPTVLDEKQKVEPTEDALEAQYGPGVTIDAILSTGLWTPPTVGPGSQSGSQSCWFSQRDLIDPVNPLESLKNFFLLSFSDDDGAKLGWDMTVVLEGLGPQSYRGENDLTGPGGKSLQELYEEQGEPFIIRFQGAHAVGALAQPCSVPLSGVDSPIVDGSLTNWVEHPADLNTFFSDPALTANIFRFVVIWDSTIVPAPKVVGIDGIDVFVSPD